jgi:hypothetical protein
MDKTLSPEQLAVYKRIDEILWTDWDPIGVSLLPDWPKDEYHSYLPDVFSLALRNASPEEIAMYLHEVVSKSMCLRSKVSNHLPVAVKILAARTGP